VFGLKLGIAQKMIDRSKYKNARNPLEKSILKKANGCKKTGMPDRNDWIGSCDLKIDVYWKIHEIAVLLKIVS
jgi:hypothetical protein